MRPKDRGAKRADPLGPRTSRVKKTRASKRRLPSWYYRVRRLRGDPGDSDYHESPSDYDEDLSELEEESKQEDGAEQLEEDEEVCECCGEDPFECDCQFPGDNAEEYYDMKKERKERKREKLRDRQGKVREFEYEKRMEEEIHTAYESLKKARREHRKVPVGPLLDADFSLFCSDHVDHFYESADFYPSKSASFWRPNDLGEPHDPYVKALRPYGKTGVFGEVLLGGNVNFLFGPFYPPRHASRKPIKLQSFREEHVFEVSIQFLGNGYLKLMISRDIVCKESCLVRLGAPEVFNFVGIAVDTEKVEAEVEKSDMEACQKLSRPRSPRESFFESTHPMGAFKSGLFG